MEQKQPQTWNAASYEANARFVSDLGSGVVELLDAKPGERVLDVGCGDCALTAKIAASGADVIGVDLSDDLLAAANARGLNARKMSGEKLRFEDEFDAVFSNAALHWMKDGRAVIASVYRALKRGGRFVAEFGGQGNVAAIHTALRAVLERRGVDAKDERLFFPSLAEYTEMLEAAGFRVEWMALIPRPTALPASGMAGWIDTFGRHFLNHVAEEERSAMRDEAVELLRPALCDSQGNWTADYVRLRFVARKV